MSLVMKLSDQRQEWLWVRTYCAGPADGEEHDARVVFEHV